MKYAPLLFVLSAASLLGCGPSEDASVPVVPPLAAEPAQTPAPAAPPAAHAQVAEPAPAVQAEPAPQASDAPAGQPAPTTATPAGAPEPDLAHGQQIYRQACAFCHDRGVAGAPKAGDAAAWSPRLARGTEALYASALHGKGAMPAKGGNPSLTQADVKAAVDHLVAQAR